MTKIARTILLLPSILTIRAIKYDVAHKVVLIYQFLLILQKLRISSLRT